MTAVPRCRGRPVEAWRQLLCGRRSGSFGRPWLSQHVVIEIGATCVGVEGRRMCPMKGCSALALRSYPSTQGATLQRLLWRASNPSK